MSGVPRSTRTALLVVAAAATASAARAQDSGPGLDYGPHGIGFQVIEALDSARAFRPRRDFSGRAAAETARPVQISIWYPAAVPGDAPRLPAGAFRLLRETELAFGAVVSPEEAERVRTATLERAVAFGADRREAEAMWDGPTPAVRDADPLPGPHPTVLYFTAAGVSNPLLPAYLASHGFVVASFPSNGRMTEVSLEFSPNPLTLATDVDDAGFAFGRLRRLPFADPRRLALVSFSSGSLAALLWQMRDMQAAALVSIEGWERFRRGADIVATSAHFEPRRVRVPLLMIERAEPETSPAYARVPDVVDNLPYSARTRVAFRDAAHADLLSHPIFGHTPDHPRIYAAAARMVRLFLEAQLEGDSDADHALANLRPPEGDPFFSVARQPAVGPVPTEEELFRLAETDPAAAVAAYRHGTRHVEGRRLFRERVLTRAATFAGDPGARATILGIVVDAYPESVGARVGLGEALAEAGRTWESAAALREALALLESGPGLDDTARDRWQRRIHEALAELPLP